MDESKVEDALARVLRDSYTLASMGKYQLNPRTNNDVSADEKLLREALFGEQSKKTDRG